jgi:hypothetical protein
VFYIGAHERSRIDAANDDGIRWWAKGLGFTRVALFDAVEKVGPSIADVRRHLDEALAGGRPTPRVIA